MTSRLVCRKLAGENVKNQIKFQLNRTYVGHTKYKVRETLTQYVCWGLIPVTDTNLSNSIRVHKRLPRKRTVLNENQTTVMSFKNERKYKSIFNLEMKTKTSVNLAFRSREFTFTYKPCNHRVSVKTPV